jgi:hypothetical protein
MREWEGNRPTALGRLNRSSPACVDEEGRFDETK